MECRVCAKTVEHLKKCSVCRAVSYCSVDCQKVDWNQHKKVCQKPAEA